MGVSFVLGASAAQLLRLAPKMDSGVPDPVGALAMLPCPGVWLVTPAYYAVVIASRAKFDTPVVQILIASIGNGLAYCGIWWMIGRTMAGARWTRWALGLGGLAWLGLVALTAFVGGN